jgi:hypothetical protein
MVHTVQYGLRHCATSQRVPGSIPGRHWEFFSDASDKSMCPGSTQPLRNEYQDIPGGKGGRCVGLTTLPAECADCLEIREP